MLIYIFIRNIGMCLNIEAAHFGKRKFKLILYVNLKRTVVIITYNNLPAIWLGRGP